ncbi:MAG: site-2 protease family protein [candidate division Zixibacteria bacterium]|nr:site-2 protease family protein [candidate division Zixibacteria bacterium]
MSKVDYYTEEKLKNLSGRLRNFIQVEAIFEDGRKIILRGRKAPGAIVFAEELINICRVEGFDCEVDIDNDTVVIGLLTANHREENKRRREIPWVNILLFAATFITATFVQMTDLTVAGIWDGLKYSIPLLSILLFHESGHYIASVRHKVKVSLPYFLPSPFILGTFGAFIKSKSPFRNRIQLLDVGAAGPIAGFVIAVIAVVIGLMGSEVVQIEDTAAGIGLGDSLLFNGLVWLIIGDIPEGYDLLLNPIAFAGWVGLLVTMLNLLPSGQLDGGHITYALFGRRQKFLSKLVVLAIIPLGFLWPGWFVWAFFLTVLIPEHPPTIDDGHALDRKRKITGYICLVIFILTFTPIPFSIPN